MERAKRSSGLTEVMALGLLVAVAGWSSGCSESSNARFGEVLRVGTDFNGWQKGEQAPGLVWDGERYRGIVALPGDELELRLFAPATGHLIGQPRGGPVQPVPSTRQAISGETDVAPLKVAVPLYARYELSFNPLSNELRIDLAIDAEVELTAASTAVVLALRGSDQQPVDVLRQRAEDLRQALRRLAIETPLTWEAGEHRGVTFLHLEPVDYPELFVVGDFDNWTAGSDPMIFALDGTVSYRGRRASGARLEYRFDLHGRRYSDPYNLEVAWDGAFVPSSPSSILGGNAGELNSVVRTPGYVETAARLRRLPLPPDSPSPEVLVHLPPGYGREDKTYPSLYVHDGKDAIVRGRYDRVLDRMAELRKIPELVAVFIAPPAEPLARLATFATNTDSSFPDVTPRGGAYERFLTDTVVPLVDRLYSTNGQRALLGIDLAGPLSFHLVWSDPEHRFTRAASQSGRFGWGATATQPSPYIDMMKTDLGWRIGRLALDYSDTDQAQASAKVHDDVQAQLMMPSYNGKVQVIRKTVPSPTVWDCLRTRLETSLPFLLGDLVPPP